MLFKVYFYYVFIVLVNHEGTREQIMSGVNMIVYTVVSMHCHTLAGCELTLSLMRSALWCCVELLVLDSAEIYSTRITASESAPQRHSSSTRTRTRAALSGLHPASVCPLLGCKALDLRLVLDILTWL